MYKNSVNVLWTSVLLFVVICFQEHPVRFQGSASTELCLFIMLNHNERACGRQVLRKSHHNQRCDLWIFIMLNCSNYIRSVKIVALLQNKRFQTAYKKNWHFIRFHHNNNTVIEITLTRPPLHINIGSVYVLSSGSLFTFVVSIADSLIMLLILANFFIIIHSVSFGATYSESQICIMKQLTYNRI